MSADNSCVDKIKIIDGVYDEPEIDKSMEALMNHFEHNAELFQSSKVIYLTISDVNGDLNIFIYFLLVYLKMKSICKKVEYNGVKVVGLYLGDYFDRAPMDEFIFRLMYSITHDESLKDVFKDLHFIVGNHETETKKDVRCCNISTLFTNTSACSLWSTPVLSPFSHSAIKYIPFEPLFFDKDNKFLALHKVDGAYGNEDLERDLEKHLKEGGDVPSHISKIESAIRQCMKEEGDIMPILDELYTLDLTVVCGHDHQACRIGQIDHINGDNSMYFKLFNNQNQQVSEIYFRVYGFNTGDQTLNEGVSCEVSLTHLNKIENFDYDFNFSKTSDELFATLNTFIKTFNLGIEISDKTVNGNSNIIKDIYDENLTRMENSITNLTLSFLITMPYELSKDIIKRFLRKYNFDINDLEELLKSIPRVIYAFFISILCYDYTESKKFYNNPVDWFKEWLQSPCCEGFGCELLGYIDHIEANYKKVYPRVEKVDPHDEQTNFN